MSQFALAVQSMTFSSQVKATLVKENKENSADRACIVDFPTQLNFQDIIVNDNVNVTESKQVLVFQWVLIILMLQILL